MAPRGTKILKGLLFLCGSACQKSLCDPLKEPLNATKKSLTVPRREPHNDKSRHPLVFMRHVFLHHKIVDDEVLTLHGVLAHVVFEQLLHLVVLVQGDLL